MLKSLKPIHSEEVKYASRVFTNATHVSEQTVLMGHVRRQLNLFFSLVKSLCKH